MSLLKANGVQIGQSGTATQNFTLSVPTSPDGTITLARGNSGATTQDILSVDTSGFLNLVQTPVQFDNTTKLASTAFVQRALGNYRSMATLDGTITTAHIGTILQPATNAGVVTFPTPTSINAPVGSSVTVWTGARSAASIATSGGATFTVDTGGYTTLPLQSGQTIRVIAASTTEWIVEGYTQKDDNFLASKAGNGYQKLPSGLIIQWGQPNMGGGSSIAVTWPITFPNAALSVVATDLGSNVVIGTSAAATTTGVTFSSTGAPSVFNYIVIGY